MASILAYSRLAPVRALSAMPARWDPAPAPGGTMRPRSIRSQLQPARRPSAHLCAHAARAAAPPHCLGPAQRPVSGAADVIAPPPGTHGPHRRCRRRRPQGGPRGGAGRPGHPLRTGSHPQGARAASSAPRAAAVPQPGALATRHRRHTRSPRAALALRTPTCQLFINGQFADAASGKTVRGRGAARPHARPQVQHPRRPVPCVPRARPCASHAPLSPPMLPAIIPHPRPRPGPLRPRCLWRTPARARQ